MTIGAYAIGGAPIAGLRSATGVSVTASGQLGTITVIVFSGSSTGDASTSSSVGTVSIVSLGGVSSGGASTSGSSNTVTLDSQSASASGSASASASFATVSIIAVSGQATVSSTAFGNLTTITIQGQAGSAIGSATGIAGFDSVIINAPNATVSSDAFISGQSATISVTTLDGAGSGSANAAGITLPGGTTLGDSSLGDIILSGNNPSQQRVTIYPYTGSAFGTANVAGNLATVLIASQAGSAEVLYPPSWARARIYSIVTATSIAKLANANNAGKQVLPIN